MPANNGMFNAWAGKKLVLYVAIPTHDDSCELEIVTPGLFGRNFEASFCFFVQVGLFGR